MAHLRNEDNTRTSGSHKDLKVVGTSENIQYHLSKWLEQFEEIQMWGDCLAFDWVLFCNIFGHAFNIPGNIHYIPIDVCSILVERGIDADVNREDFAQIQDKSIKHNALHDAYVIFQCYKKLYP